MAYDKIMQMPGGGTAIVRFSGKRPVRCHFCHRDHTKLCDFPKGEGTCDLPLCDEHAVPAGKGKDHCFNHPANHAFPRPTL